MHPITNRIDHVIDGSIKITTTPVNEFEIKTNLIEFQSLFLLPYVSALHQRHKEKFFSFFSDLLSLIVIPSGK